MVSWYPALWRRGVVLVDLGVLPIVDLRRRIVNDRPLAPCEAGDESTARHLARIPGYVGALAATVARRRQKTYSPSQPALGPGVTSDMCFVNKLSDLAP
jgi:hypothetical protein